VEYRNLTDLELAPRFILEKLQSFDTTRLRLHLKLHRRRDSPVSGYFRFKDCLIVAAVRRVQRFPLKNRWPVATRPAPGWRGWAWVCDEEEVRDRDELLVWVAAHEIYHFLRHTRQVPGIQRETRANRFAFEWLREFKAVRASATAA